MNQYKKTHLQRFTFSNNSLTAEEFGGDLFSVIKESNSNFEPIYSDGFNIKIIGGESSRVLVGVYYLKNNDGYKTSIKSKTFTFSEGTNFSGSET